jgi:hypothetical protein
MTKYFRWMCLSGLVLLLGAGIALNAQDTAPKSTPPDPRAQQPAPAPEQAQPAQPGQMPDQVPETKPDQAAPTSAAPTSPAPTTAAPTAPAATDSPSATPQASGVQSFTGTVVKSGDKYVLQESETGTMYDLDSQERVKSFEGKKVKVQGTLDANGKMIHIVQ